MIKICTHTASRAAQIRIGIVAIRQLLPVSQTAFARRLVLSIKRAAAELQGRPTKMKFPVLDNGLSKKDVQREVR